jgi:hypothetical protein
MEINKCGRDQIEVLGRYLLGRAEKKNSSKSSIRIADASAEMQTAYFPNTNLKLYRYITLFDRPDMTWLFTDQTVHYMTLCWPVVQSIDI